VAVGAAGAGAVAGDGSGTGTDGSSGTDAAGAAGIDVVSMCSARGFDVDAGVVPAGRLERGAVAGAGARSPSTTRVLTGSVAGLGAAAATSAGGVTGVRASGVVIDSAGAVLADTCARTGVRRRSAQEVVQSAFSPWGIHALVQDLRRRHGARERQH